MACCVLAAFFITHLINICETFDINLKIQLKDSTSTSFNSSNPTALCSKQKDGKITTRLMVLGMTCATCSESVEKSLLKIDGVESVRTSVLLDRVTVVREAERVGIERVKSAIEDVGFEVLDEVGTEPGNTTAGSRSVDELKRLRSAFYGSMMITGGIIVLERFGHREFPTLTKTATAIVGTLLQFRYGWWIHENAFRKARKGMLNMGSLITVSVVMSLLLSFMNLCIFGRTGATYFKTASALVMIVSGGRYLGLLSRHKAGDPTANLFGLVQETFMVKLCSAEEPIPASLLEPGDQILIDPYTIIPSDAYILSGHSDVNESLVTGESLPVYKSTGDFLLAGTRNGQATLTAIVQHEQRDSFLMSLIDSVENSQESKAGIQEMVGFVTQYFVAGIMVLAVLRGVSAYLLAGEGLEMVVRINLAATAAMAVLTAACPCALGLATPSAIMAGLDAARSAGILITGGASTMETMQKIDHVILDKTGTLTTGLLCVKNIEPSEKWWTEWKTFCLLVCAAEETTAPNHPAAGAVFKSLLQNMVPEWQEYKSRGSLVEFESRPGQGVSALVDLGDGKLPRICVGNARLMDEFGVEITKFILPHEKIGGLKVYVAIDNVYAGVITLGDTAKPDAESAIRKLRARGLTLGMLTGDLAPEASRIAKELCINIHASKASPQEKQTHIQALQSQGHSVAMVGDGPNDTPSLSTANLGVMLSHSFSCFTAGGQILILSPHLSAIPRLFDIAEQTMRQVRWNLIWAAGYNLVVVGLAMGIGGRWVVLSPEVSASLTAMSSVAIGWQSLRLRKRLMKGG